MHKFSSPTLTQDIEMSHVFRAFADENRLKVLQLINDGEYSASELLTELDCSQPTLSHHMRLLCDSGLVSRRKHNKNVFYSINTKSFGIVEDYIRALYSKKGK
jgi:ArsR family transcriptional regulator